MLKGRTVGEVDPEHPPVRTHRFHQSTDLFRADEHVSIKALALDGVLVDVVPRTLGSGRCLQETGVNGGPLDVQDVDANRVSNGLDRGAAAKRTPTRAGIRSTVLTDPILGVIELLSRGGGATSTNRRLPGPSSSPQKRYRTATYPFLAASLQLRPLSGREANCRETVAVGSTADRLAAGRAGHKSLTGPSQQ